MYVGFNVQLEHERKTTDLNIKKNTVSTYVSDTVRVVWTDTFVGKKSASVTDSK